MIVKPHAASWSSRIRSLRARGFGSGGTLSRRGQVCARLWRDVVVQTGVARRARPLRGVLWTRVPRGAAYPSGGVHCISIGCTAAADKRDRAQGRSPGVASPALVLRAPGSSVDGPGGACGPLPRRRSVRHVNRGLGPRRLLHSGELRHHSTPNSEEPEHRTAGARNPAARLRDGVWPPTGVKV